MTPREEKLSAGLGAALEAKRAGREATIGSLAGIPAASLEAALAYTPPVGEEFAILRELRRRRRWAAPRT